MQMKKGKKNQKENTRCQGCFHSIRRCWFFVMVTWTHPKCFWKTENSLQIFSPPFCFCCSRLWVLYPGHWWPLWMMYPKYLMVDGQSVLKTCAAFISMKTKKNTPDDAKYSAGKTTLFKSIYIHTNPALLTKNKFSSQLESWRICICVFWAKEHLYVYTLKVWS